MSVDTLPGQAETLHAPNTLPQGEALQDIYKQEFGSLRLPNSYRMGAFLDPNVRYGEPPADDPDYINNLRDAYITQASKQAVQGSWWTKASEVMKMYGLGPAVADSLPLIAKHSVRVVAHGVPTDQGFNVLAVGRSEDTEATEVAFETLQVLDQFSGGLLAADTKRPSIVLSNGIKLWNNNDGGETGGFAASGVAFINVSGLRRLAEESGANFRDLLATAITHETLGHNLEQLIESEGKTGQLFGRHFNYSDELVDGEIFNNLHVSVEPKDTSKIGSRPVREYGRLNPAEDLATSVDATVARAMGWTASIEASPRFHSYLDTYRDDLVLGFMARAARVASKYSHTPGIVGNEIRHITGADGSVHFEPARKFEVSSLYGEAAIKSELQRVVARYRPGDQFVVSSGDIM